MVYKDVFQSYIQAAMGWMKLQYAKDNQSTITYLFACMSVYLCPQRAFVFIHGRDQRESHTEYKLCSRESARIHTINTPCRPQWQIYAWSINEVINTFSTLVCSPHPLLITLIYRFRSSCSFPTFNKRPVKQNYPILAFSCTLPFWGGRKHKRRPFISIGHQWFLRGRHRIWIRGHF